MWEMIVKTGFGFASKNYPSIRKNLQDTIGVSSTQCAIIMDDRP